MTRWAMAVMALVGVSTLNSAYADPRKPNVSWKFLESNEGIESESGSVDDTPLKAFRGTGIVEARIGRVISILFDHPRANEWVHELVVSTKLRDLEDESVVVWQRFDNPWPVLDRDFVYRAEPIPNKANKYFRAWFTDIADTDIVLADAERAKIPDQSCCVVARLIYSEWQFRATGPESTCVRVEVLLDPKGWVPAFFVNWFQRNWPYMTIKSLRKQAEKEDITPHKAFDDWTGGDPGSTISRAQCEQGRLAG